MLNNISEIENCTGCASCAAICPKECISMKYDDRGFLMPHVDHLACVNCRLCISVCPTERIVLSEPVDVLGARVPDDEILLKSTSGGVFTAISDYILSIGGYVCGAVYGESFEVVHVCSNSIKQRNLMRGAKYVQSNTLSCFKDIIMLLRENKKVLFTGTPCQVAGIKNIAEHYEISNNLYTVDIVCHGVPSSRLFIEYVHYLKEKYGEISNINFRNKEIGWRGQNITIQTESKKPISAIDRKLFSGLYFSNLIMRDSCNSCKFASIYRAGDITMGDFWGISDENPMYDDNKGVSILLINTSNGQELLRMIRDQINSFTVYGKSYIQPNMMTPTKKSVDSDLFWTMYKKNGISCYTEFDKRRKVMSYYRKIKAKINKLLPMKLT